MKKFLPLILLLSFLFSKKSDAQFESVKDSVVQLYGIVMTADSLVGIPAVSVTIKGSNRGTITNNQGVFSIVVLKGDVIDFTHVSYKPKSVVVPKNLEGNQYSVVQLMVEEGRDPAVIASLAKAARAYLESGGKDSSMPPELRQEAMRAGIIAEGASFGDLLIRAIQNSSDEYFIQSAIYALAGSEEETTLKTFLALALTPTIRTGDLRYVQRYFAREPLAKQVYWAWFKANFDAIEKRLSRYGMSSAPAIQKFGCDAASKAGLHAFFAPKLHDLEGLPRVLQQSEEGIQRCMAFKASKGAQINAALAALH